MNVEQFIATFRRDMEDTVEPFLWSDEDIVSYLQLAVDEACERAWLIEDRITPEVCAIALQIAVRDYRLHESVLKVKRLSFNGRALTERSVEWLDEHQPNWETLAPGEPRVWIQDFNGGLQLVPAPDKVGTANLTVYRTPLEPLTVDNDQAEPEIRPIFHDRLLPFMFARAYLKTDTETYDLALANRHESVFERHFGVKPDAKVRRKRQDQRPPVTRVIF